MWFNSWLLVMAFSLNRSMNWQSVDFQMIKLIVIKQQFYFDKFPNHYTYSAKSSHFFVAKYQIERTEITIILFSSSFEDQKSNWFETVWLLSVVIAYRKKSLLKNKNANISHFCSNQIINGSFAGNQLWFLSLATKFYVSVSQFSH